MAIRRTGVRCRTGRPSFDAMLRLAYFLALLSEGELAEICERPGARVEARAGAFCDAFGREDFIETDERGGSPDRDGFESGAEYHKFSRRRSWCQNADALHTTRI